MSIDRRSLIAGGLAAALSADASALDGPDLKRAPGPLPETALGSASETLYVYLSMGCPSCARFHSVEIPRLRRSLVEPGQIRIVYREYPLDPRSFAAAMVARRAGDRFFDAVDIFFSEQESWKAQRDAAPAFRDIAGRVGIDRAGFDALVADRALYDAIGGIKKHGSALGVRGTPTLFLYGEKVEGDLPAAEIERRYG